MNHFSDTGAVCYNSFVKEPLLVLFDGNALVHRAYHALPPLTNSKTGETLNAVYGFTTMFLKVVNELKPTCYTVAFDRAAPTFRHQMYKEYKIQRPATPDELVNQLNRVRQLVQTFNIPVFELDGFEADDILGTLSRQASEQGIETIIVTGDADTMQLVSPKVKVLYPKARGAFSNTMLYDEAAVIERYGVKPEQLADYKALVGDPSDNIPGVRGIGEKTAARLIQQFGSIDGIYQRIDEVTPPRLQELLRQNEAEARRSKELSTIVTNTPVTLDLEKCHISHFDRQKVAELFRELEFSSLLPRLPEMEAGITAQAPLKPAAEPVRVECHIVSNNRSLDDLLGELASAGSVAFELIATGPDAITARLVGIGLSLEAGEAYYLPVGHSGWGQFQQLPLERVIAALKPYFENPGMPKVAHNGNYSLTVLAEHGINVSNLAFDIMIAAHLLGEKSLTLKGLAFGRFGVEIASLTDLTGTGAKQVPIDSIDIEQMADYACTSAGTIRQLSELFETELKRQGLGGLFTDVEMPLVPVLVYMERNGVALDTKSLVDMSFSLGEQLLKLEGEIYKNVGHQFNINSTQQLSYVLFEELRLPPPRKTRGIYSTGAMVLEELRGAHPVIEQVVEYRQLAKIKSTYIDALPGLINLKTGRLHTSFNQTRTATGRLSSSDPNLQNIPVRGELGRKVRSAFIAPPGSLLLCGDYSQIDLRVLAHLSQDETLIEAFRRDEDIHAATAAQLFNVPTSQVIPDMRRVAKTVNFGVIYGMSEYGLEQATELSREEANKFIAAYFEKHPKVRQYIEATKKQTREKGYVETLLGRRRPIPEIHSSNRIIREAAERMAINMPVQGTSADIIKVAMINLYREMLGRQLRSKLLLQVHDELVFEVPENELEQMKEFVSRIMSTAITLSVPVRVDLKIGHNWGEVY